MLIWPCTQKPILVSIFNRFCAEMTIMYLYTKRFDNVTNKNYYLFRKIKINNHQCKSSLAVGGLYNKCTSSLAKNECARASVAVNRFRGSTISRLEICRL